MKYTKKLCAVLVTVAVCLTTAACSNAAVNSGSSGEVSSEQKQSGVTLTLSDTEYSNDKGVIEATWHNNSGGKIMFGKSYEIQKLTGSEWAEFAPSGQVAFDDLGIEITTGANYKIKYNLSPYDFTEPGKYRLTVNYTNESSKSANSSKIREEITVWAEFNVK